MTRGGRCATVSAMITNSLEAAVAARSAPLEEPAIRVRGVRKAYGSVKALDGVDLDVRRGEVLALLGPNGAGKTTLVEILEGHRSADAGEVDVLGFDPGRRQRAFRERIGIVLQEAALDDLLTVREAIELYSAPYPRPRPAGEVAVWSASATGSTPARTRSPAASGAGSTSRSASEATPSWSSSTSRPPASIPPPGAARGTSSAACGRSARRSC